MVITAEITVFKILVMYLSNCYNSQPYSKDIDNYNWTDVTKE
jgi:hypothetical protein